jgi:hypothetical protein
MIRLSACFDLTASFRTTKAEHVLAHVIKESTASGHWHWTTYGLAVPPPLITWMGAEHDAAWVMLDIANGLMSTMDIALPVCGWWGCINPNHLIICDKVEAIKVRRALKDGLPYVRKDI